MRGWSAGAKAGEYGRRSSADGTGDLSPPVREAFAWRLRGHLYRRTRDSGAVPTRAGLCTDLRATAGEVDEALRFLADRLVLALDDAGEVWMAHPFSAVPTSYRVETPIGDYWANCAWDAIAIPITLDIDGRTRARCPHSQAAIDLVVAAGRVEPTGTAVLLPVPARHFWDDIGFT